jgi:hypothetical protein
MSGSYGTLANALAKPLRGGNDNFLRVVGAARDAGAAPEGQAEADGAGNIESKERNG